MNEVDLHSHTTASDGAYRPADLVQLALQRGLKVLGITDHDSMQGIPEATQAAESTPLAIVPGVEINTDVNGVEVHVLGYYFFGYEHPRLIETLARLRENRLDRAEQIVTKLNMLGLQLDFNRVLDLAAGGAVGRPHIAQAMIERGFVNSTAEAFDRYLASGRPAYVPRFRVTPVEATRLIAETGGVAALAHPLSIGAAANMGQIDLPVVLPELKAAGLAGLETYYTGYSAENIKTLLGYCDRFDLIPTGGSDFHGGGVLTISDLGTVPVPPEVVERLRDANRKNTGG